MYVVWRKNYGDALNTLVCTRDKEITKKTRNQYASPMRQCNTSRPRAEAILTKSCVIEGFVTQEAKTFLRFS